jgi:hypothetical protein
MLTCVSPAPLHAPDTRAEPQVLPPRGHLGRTITRYSILIMENYQLASIETSALVMAGRWGQKGPGQLS